MSTVTETRPTYTTEPPPQVDARRRILTNVALADTDAISDALLLLARENGRLADELRGDALPDNALYIARHSLADLRQRVEALGAGL